MILLKRYRHFEIIFNALCYALPFTRHEIDFNAINFCVVLLDIELRVSIARLINHCKPRRVGFRCQLVQRAFHNVTRRKFSEIVRNH